MIVSLSYIKIIVQNIIKNAKYYFFSKLFPYLRISRFFQTYFIIYFMRKLIIHS